MATATTAAQEVIDQRLDALDRALLGLLPRSERLAIVLDVEARVQASLEGNSALLDDAAVPPEDLASAATSQSSGRNGPTLRRRVSVLARTSGVLGIVALGSLLAAPITYLLALFLSDAVDEVAAYLVLGLNVVVIAVGGATAVALGIAALVRIGRSGDAKRGTGGRSPHSPRAACPCL